jgi:hypothetical protein
MESDGARLTAMESLCTSSPMHRTGRLAVTGETVWGGMPFAAGQALNRAVCLHGVYFPFFSCLGRESHNLWLGTVCAVQPTFTPETRHRFCFHLQPSHLGHFELSSKYVPDEILSILESTSQIVVYSDWFRQSGTYVAVCCDAYNLGRSHETVVHHVQAAP